MRVCTVCVCVVFVWGLCVCTVCVCVQCVCVRGVCVRRVCVRGVCVCVCARGVCAPCVCARCVCARGVCVRRVCVRGVCARGVCARVVCVRAVCVRAVCARGVCVRGVCRRWRRGGRSEWNRDGRKGPIGAVSDGAGPVCRISTKEKRCPATALPLLRAFILSRVLSKEPSRQGYEQWSPLVLQLCLATVKRKISLSYSNYYEAEWPAPTPRPLPVRSPEMDLAVQEPWVSPSNAFCQEPSLGSGVGRWERRK